MTGKLTPSKTYIIQHKETKELWKTDKGKSSWSKPGFAKNSWAQSGNRYSRRGNVAHGRFDDQNEYGIVELISLSQSKLNRIEALVELTEEWCADQENGMTDGSICISAMKDIRRILKEK